MKTQSLCKPFLGITNDHKQTVVSMASQVTTDSGGYGITSDCKHHLEGFGGLKV